MKVHIVTAANRDRYGRELEQMHRQRHEVFVGGLGWTELARKDGLERDQFDDASAVYLVAMENGDVQGSLRLLPTWRRCMLTECWPQSITHGEAPRGAGVWEWTRWCPGTMARPKTLVRARRALILAALEFARSRFIETYVTYCDTKFLGQLVELGWAPEPLGLPQPYGQSQAVGVVWAVADDLLERTRALLGVRDPVALEAPPRGRVSVPVWLLEQLLEAQPDAGPAAPVSTSMAA
mgnify:CR=1 FL=1